ncbi:MAG: Invasion associated locus B family protein [Candidatus Tokpelaia hoelldobleri]|uniref:Invasion associated locus B family protein n=1 Tax=Candidatus Tokpelaia hoelldobleri TaxID=1902579 RepID=A0A1U9JVC9_9HYPH|nr:MAG: Invasion associated locus B family protein [Candidatus Tokpelaia hoelldoblerii]
MKKIKTAFYGVIAGLSLYSASATAQLTAPTSLPNGANSINEQYGQWAVSCSLQNNAKLCVIGQQRYNSNGQPVMSINLQDEAGGGMTAVVVLPFGVMVSKPVVFHVDEAKNRVETSIRTCLPQGCMVSVKFDKSMISALQSGKTLNVVPRSAAQGEEEVKNLTFDLEGFGAALERLKSLGK